MYRHLVHSVELITGQYLLIVIEHLCQLVLSPEANPPPCLGCHFFALDKEADGFKREHPAWGCPSVPSTAILCFAAWLQIHLSCAFQLSLLKDTCCPGVLLCASSKL
jgi:hypothetical protein